MAPPKLCWGHAEPHGGEALVVRRPLQEASAPAAVDEPPLAVHEDAVPSVIALVGRDGRVGACSGIPKALPVTGDLVSLHSGALSEVPEQTSVPIADCQPGLEGGLGGCGLQISGKEGHGIVGNIVVQPRE